MRRNDMIERIKEALEASSNYVYNTPESAWRDAERILETMEDAGMRPPRPKPVEDEWER